MHDLLPGRPRAIADTADTPRTWGLAIWLITFFFLYSVSFRLLPEPLYTARIIALFTMLLFASCMLYWRGRSRVPRDVITVVCLYIAYMLWTASRTVVTGAEDTSLLANAALLLVQVLPSGMLIGYWLAKRRATFQDVILLLQTVIVAQAVLIVLTFVSWDFRLLTLDILNDSSNQVDAYHPFRVRGLTHATGAKLAAFQALGVLFSAYLLIRARTLRRIVYLTASVAILLGSILLTGRTGFLMLAIVLVFVTVYVSMRQRIPRGLAVAAVLVPLGALAGFFFLKYLYYLMEPATGSAVGGDAFERLLRWVGKELWRYIDSGEFQSSTVANLVEHHWFLPTDDVTLLLGEPATWTLHRVHSDVGLVRVIFGSGLIGACLLYGAGLIAWTAALCRVRMLDEQLMLIAVLAWFVLLELKEPIFVDLRFASLLIMLMMYCVSVVRNSPETLPQALSAVKVR